MALLGIQCATFGAPSTQRARGKGEGHPRHRALPTEFGRLLGSGLEVVETFMDQAPEFVTAVLLREAAYWEQSHSTNLSKCLPSEPHAPHTTHHHPIVDPQNTFLTKPPHWFTSSSGSAIRHPTADAAIECTLF